MSELPEMLQRVATAIKAEIGRQLSATPIDQPGDWMATGGTIDLEPVARAAIAAMRKPTPYMVERGSSEVSSENLTEIEAFREAKASYKAMIDAALSERGGQG
jgi:hypothetical protein